MSQTRTLRVSHVILHPVLTWDDGAELSPGPELQPVQLSVSQAKAMLDNLPVEVEALEQKLAEQDAD